MVAKLTISEENLKKVAVISHERSGTHFLMNTIALNFNYISKPWWNFDFREAINFHSPRNIKKYFRRTHGKSVENILKSHHVAGFFDEVIDYFSAEFQIFYIYRDPRDALISNWKLIRSFPWDEGPRPESASQFIRAEPSGAMMRYQKTQERNMLSRWQTHVEGWIDLAENQPNTGICVLSYEELNLEFETTVQKIGEVLGEEVDVIRKPTLTEKVIGSGQGKVGSYREHLNEDDLAYVWDEVGDTLTRLKYCP